MQIEAFKESLGRTSPQSDWSPYLKALWYDAKENWNMAHNLVQDMPDDKAAWIHAYLHRKEGDIGNADYWYYKAGKKRPALSLSDEWEDIVAAFL